MCLLQSGIDASQMHALSNIATRVKSIGVQSLAQLMALVELLNTSLFQEKTLLILEGVQVILTAQKVLYLMNLSLPFDFSHSDLLLTAIRWSDIIVFIGH